MARSSRARDGPRSIHVQKAVKNPERSFGLSVGGVLCALAALLAWRGHIGRAEVLGVLGLVLLVAGLVYPLVLARPAALWFRFARVLGHINARVLLTVVFGLVFVPMSIVWRLIGKDPLARRRDRFAGWSPHPAAHRDPSHYTRMY